MSLRTSIGVASLAALGLASAVSAQQSGQSFVQLADLDPANALGPRLTWTVTQNKFDGNRLFGDISAKITLIDAVASPPIAYEFASDAYWNRVLFGQKDVYIGAYKNSGTGLTTVRGPGGIDVSARRTVFIADQMNSRVLIARFDAAARTMTQVGVVNADTTTGRLRNVVDVAWDGRSSPLTDEYFYALDADGKISYWQWTGTAAVLQWTYGSLGSGEGQFLNATGICVGHQSAFGGGTVFTPEFYVTDAGNRRITWFTRGASGPQWPTSVTLPNDGVPADCSVDHYGNVIVTDSKNHRLVKYNRPLWLIDTYGTYGVGPTNYNTFATPHAVHVPYGTKRNAQGQTIWYGEGRVLTAEAWSAQTGALEHYLGVHAAFTSAPETTSTSAFISFRITDMAFLYADVHRVGVGTVATLYANQLFGAGGGYGLWWDGRFDDGTPAPHDYYQFRVYGTSAYGCPPSGGGSWCHPFILSQSFFMKYCPPSGDDPPLSAAIGEPMLRPWDPCGPSATAEAGGSGAADAPTTLFLRQRVLLAPHPAARLAGPAGAAPAENATGEASLADAVRRYGVRGLTFSVTPAAAVSPVKIRVYSAAGRLVRTLVNEQLTAGVYEVGWDGTDDGGRRAMPGVYVAHMSVGGFRATQRLILRQPL